MKIRASRNSPKRRPGDVRRSEGTTTITITLPEDAKETLAKLAASENRSISN